MEGPFSRPSKSIVDEGAAYAYIKKAGRFVLLTLAGSGAIPPVVFDVTGYHAPVGGLNSYRGALIFIRPSP
jgi:hypothetical protein